jgi:hypothetical protein
MRFQGSGHLSNTSGIGATTIILNLPGLAGSRFCRDWDFRAGWPPADWTQDSRSRQLESLSARSVGAAPLRPSLPLVLERSDAGPEAEARQFMSRDQQILHQVMGTQLGSRVTLPLCQQ